MDSHWFHRNILCPGNMGFKIIFLEIMKISIFNIFFLNFLSGKRGSVSCKYSTENKSLVEI